MPSLPRFRALQRGEEHALLKAKQLLRRTVAHMSMGLGKNLITQDAALAEEDVERLVAILVREQLAREAGVRGIFGGLPTFIRARLAEARRGGRSGYREVGALFASCLLTMEPDDLEADEWEATIESVGRDLAVTDLDDAAAVDAAWQWVETHFPRLPGLVPVARRPRFVAGMIDAAKEGDL